MDVLQLILTIRPGAIQEIDDRLEIQHDSGEHSTLWRNATGTVSEGLSPLDDLYREFDGMDLFSSTFKVAAMSGPREKNGVRLVFSLEDLRKELDPVEARFMESAIPFMYQAGIGYYALSIERGSILEWDTELEELGEEYQSFEQILDEWVNAVS